MFLPVLFPICSLPTIPLPAEAKLDSMAAQKANLLKDSSVKEAMATPPMTGISDRYLYQFIY